MAGRAILGHPCRPLVSCPELRSLGPRRRSAAGPLLALRVDVPGRAAGGTTDRDAAESLAYAEDLGAELVRATGASLADAIDDVCRRRRVTHIVLPHQPSGSVVARLRPSLADQILTRLPDIEVHLVAAPSTE